MIPPDIINGLWPVSRREYHQDHSRIGSSMLKDFRESIPVYAAKYIFGTVPHGDETPEMRLGTAVHTLALEPQHRDRDLAVGPDCERRSNADKARWEAFEAANVGKTILKPEQLRLAQDMAAAIRRHPKAGQILEQTDAIIEQPIQCEDPTTGLPIKVMLDHLSRSGQMVGLISDIKTTSSVDLSPGKWGYIVNEFGYECQAAFYFDAVTLAMPEIAAEGLAFCHIVVSKEPPHEVVCFAVSPNDLHIGRVANRKALDEMAECVKNDKWESRYPGVQDFALPGWRYNKR